MRKRRNTTTHHTGIAGRGIASGRSQTVRPPLRVSPHSSEDSGSLTDLVSVDGDAPLLPRACRRFTRKLHQVIDDRQSPDQHPALREHAAMCPVCAQQLEAWLLIANELSDATASASGESVLRLTSPTMSSEDLKNAVVRSANGAPSVRRGTVDWMGRLRKAWTISTSIAAAACLMVFAYNVYDLDNTQTAPHDSVASASDSGGSTGGIGGGQMVVTTGGRPTNWHSLTMDALPSVGDVMSSTQPTWDSLRRAVSPLTSTLSEAMSILRG
ncbi:MAG: hypothetical protein AAFP90_15065 [Planctomycetota bacterium]